MLSSRLLTLKERSSTHYSLLPPHCCSHSVAEMSTITASIDTLTPASLSRKSPSIDIPLPVKRVAVAFESRIVLQEIGKLISNDVKLVQQVGWQQFVKHCQGQGDLASLNNTKHPAGHLLQKHRGPPVNVSSVPWTQAAINKAIKWGPHSICQNHIDF